MTGRHWTEARVIHATERWKAGASAREIAEELGGVTRNAVIGLVSRKGLQKRLSNGAATGARTLNLRKKRERNPHAPTRLHRKPGLPPLQFALLIEGGELPGLPADIDFGPGVTLIERAPNGCNFAVSPHAATTHLFCNAPRVEGHSWCLAHCRIAYQPPRPRARRVAA